MFAHALHTVAKLVKWKLNMHQRYTVGSEKNEGLSLWGAKIKVKQQQL